MAVATPTPMPTSASSPPHPFVPFSDVLSDSPKFRSRLSAAESQLDDLESRLERVLKTASAATEAGKSYVAQQGHFLASLWELSSHFSSLTAASTSSTNHSNLLAGLNGLIQAHQEIVKLQNQAVEQAGKALAKGLNKFLR